MNPDLDLVLERVIHAPRSTVWAAWTDPDRFAKWWVPAPTLCRVDRLDVRPGGGLVTQMSDDGTKYVPQLDVTFLVVEDLERIVFTNAIDSNWRPVNPEPVSLTAEIVLADHPDGTDYRVVVRHGDAASRNRHEQLGFFEGWGTVTQQLATVAEGTR